MNRFYRYIDEWTYASLRYDSIMWYWRVFPLYLFSGLWIEMYWLHKMHKLTKEFEKSTVDNPHSTHHTSML